MGTQASPTTGAGSPSDAANVVLFQVAGKSFAIDLTQVERIIDYREPTKTPRRPPHVDGVLEDQGRYVPVVNLRKRLGVSDVGPAHPAVLLIADAGPDPLVGLVVDQVLRILSLPARGSGPATQGVWYPSRIHSGGGQRRWSPSRVARCHEAADDSRRHHAARVGRDETASRVPPQRRSYGLGWTGVVPCPRRSRWARESSLRMTA